MHHGGFGNSIREGCNRQMKGRSRLCVADFDNLHVMRVRASSIQQIHEVLQASFFSQRFTTQQNSRDTFSGLF
jgi:hypothetical protein